MHMSFVPDTQNKEFQDALNLIQYTRQSVFLTGKAGTGKSTFLRYICEHTKKKHVVLAPTGIAAINAGGSTLHSFFKLPFYPLLPDDPNFSLQRGRIHEFFKYTKPHRKLLEELELVIIDEISMVRQISSMPSTVFCGFTHATSGSLSAENKSCWWAMYSSWSP